MPFDSGGSSSSTEIPIVMTAVTVARDGTFFRRVVQILAKLSYSVLFILVSLVGMLWYFQEKLLFYPKSPAGLEAPDKNPKPFQHPGQMNMAYEDVWILTKDGCRLHAWLIKQKSPLDYTSLPTLIFFQGNAGNMGLRLTNLFQLYQNCRINIFAVSYRGYGFSSGLPSENGVYIDAEAALDCLLGRKDLDANKFFVFGRSIGGAVAIDLAFKRPAEIRAVIVENTFTSIREMVDIVFPFLKPFASLISLAQRLFMDSMSKVPSLMMPVLYISGLQDALVPPAHVARLYEATSMSKCRRLLPVANGSHNDTWQQAGPEYYQEINKFIADAMERDQNVRTTMISSPKKNFRHPSDEL